MSYFVDVVDKAIFDFVQEALLKDKLIDLLEDIPFDDDAPEVTIEEAQSLEMLVDTDSERPEKRISQARKWWKKVTCKKKRHPLLHLSRVSPIILALRYLVRSS